MLTTIDWVLIAAYFLFSFGIAAYYFRRASKNTSEFFLSGRNLPWWLAGTGMVATTFAADTPLAVTELVAQSGIAGNWLWWNFAFGGILTVFFFSRLWRRSGVLTDVEFVEMRYSGKAAAWLRGIKAIYFGLVMNVIIIGWVSLAMETIFEILFPNLSIAGQTSFNFIGFEFSAALLLTGILILVVAIYSLLSGLWGVTVTDAFQFVVAMTGTIVLAVMALNIPQVGGLSGLLDQLPETTFKMLPTVGNVAEGAGVLALSAAAFVAYIGVQWWSSWYPGAEPGGGGYVAQRMMSAKDERHSLFATLWFNVAHYCLRPWPWIIVALASLVLYPGLADPRQGYVMVMRDALPPGLLGLLVAAFLAAFMSTVATQLNWGTSYVVNDFWRRFIRPNGDEKYYVAVARITTFALAVLSVFVTSRLESISEAWGLVLTASAGLGLVLILRWYWWRINAWSELVATLTPIVLTVLALVLALFDVTLPGIQEPFPINLFTVVGITTPLWLIATFITRPTAQSTLDSFYQKVRPGGPGWGPLTRRHPQVMPDSGLARLAIDWLVGVVFIYSTLFGVGYLLFGRTLAAIILIAIAGISAAFLWWHISRSEQVVLIDPV